MHEWSDGFTIWFRYSSVDVRLIDSSSSSVIARRTLPSGDAISATIVTVRPSAAAEDCVETAGWHHQTFSPVSAVITGRIAAKQQLPVCTFTNARWIQRSLSKGHCRCCDSLWWRQLIPTYLIKNNPQTVTIVNHF